MEPTDEELAAELLKQPENPKRRWIWIYGYNKRGKDGEIFDRVDEVHLFDDAAIPEELRSMTTFPLGDKPLCGHKLLEQRPFWFILNTGGGDACRLATIAGNAIIICANCKRIEQETP